MLRRGSWRVALSVAAVLVLGWEIHLAGSQQASPVSASDCSYLQNTAEYKLNPQIIYADRTARTQRLSSLRRFASSPRTIDAGTMPRRNFVDTAIFDRMQSAGIASAPLTTDEEFIRRVTLDLTGRIPSVDQLQTFLSNNDPAKRDALVDSLIGSPEFIDKWTMFLGDLYKNTSTSSNIVRYPQGAAAFYLFIKDAVSRNMPYDVLSRAILTAAGDSFLKGEVNWILGGNVPMGPIQDTYDGLAVNTASTFLGINTVDCLLCHDGAHHLDQVNLWGMNQTRANMWGLSAFFTQISLSRQNLNGVGIKTILTDNPSNQYNLNTTTGNRTARQSINGTSVVMPNNPFEVNDPNDPSVAGVASGETRRQAIARQVTTEFQFSRAIVNYVWEKFMVQAFVTPSNSFDLARLDPGSTLPDGWALQPTNADLLNSLALWFQGNGYDLRALMSLIVKSNAYQLSSSYPGDWKTDYVPYYARKYVRRLDAEEVHDAIQQATGIKTIYAVANVPSFMWAMQSPEPFQNTAARTPNPDAAQLLLAFGQGDRDLNPRRNDGSVIEALNLMNNNFVINRIHVQTGGQSTFPYNGTLAVLTSSTSDPGAIIQGVFQATLSRNPSPDEMATYLPILNLEGIQQGTEDLQWVLLNKLDFLFNY